MPRPSWSGSIRLSLVTVPVKGYTALAGDRGRVTFNQLHNECHSRIQYKKTCPIHGEVENAEIVKGYKYGPDQYAIVDPDEINQLRSEADRAVTIDKFIPAGTIDPIYFSGQTYYLLPDGRQALKPYAVLRRAIADEDVWGLAQVVISNREQLVVLRPLGELLTISVLNYSEAVRPASTFEEDLNESDVTAAEVKLAKTLIETVLDKDPQLEEYRDLYNDRLEALVQAKIAGEEIASPPSEERGPPVIDFMGALKASLERKRPRSPAAKKPDRAKRSTRSAAARRRKSG
jgi:DNA end-binding protein Ku